MPVDDLYFDSSGRYAIVIKEEVHPEFFEMFQLREMENAPSEPVKGPTQLIVDIKDQSELLGLLNALYDNHHTIFKVEYVSKGMPG